MREQAERVLARPAAERLRLLLHAPRPMRLVRTLPDAELYLTVREIGPGDALPLLALASAPQLQHLLDLEAWRGQRFDADRAGAWIALLLEAGEPALRRFLRSADDELLALLAQRWMRVRQIEPDGDPGRDGTGHTETGTEQGLVSPDGYHLVSPTIAEHRAAVRSILQLFFRDQPRRYAEMLWSAVSELASDIEERALHWRQSRLEEHGFPTWEEALAVYAPPVGRRERPPAREPEVDTEDALHAPRAALRVLAGDDPLAATLGALEGAERERALQELVALANRVLVADGADTGDPEAHHEALRDAAGVIGIALQARGALAPRRVREVLAELPLLELFREGHARAVELQARARALTARGWMARHERTSLLLEPPIRERLAALLLPRPRYLADAAGRHARLRPFRTGAEIEETRAAVELAELLGELTIERLGLDVLEALGGDPTTDPPRFSAFLLTLLAWHAARGALRADPLPGDVTADFLRDVASRRTADPAAAGRALAALGRELGLRCALSARETALLAAFGQACLERLAEECAGLDPAVPVDPRFVSCLRLRA